MTVTTIALVTTTPRGWVQLDIEAPPRRIMRGSAVVSPWPSLISLRQCGPRFRIDGMNVLANVHRVHCWGKSRTQDQRPRLPVHSQIYDYAKRDHPRSRNYLALTKPAIYSSVCPSFELAGITYPRTFVTVLIMLAIVLRDIKLYFI